MQKERAYSFFQWGIHDVEKHFEVDSKEGLSSQVVRHRLLKFGKNSLASLKEVSPWEIFFRQFSNLFIWILLVASVISYFVDGPIQSFIIIFIVILNVLLGFAQEFKAEKALAELKNSSKLKSKILRNGKVMVLNGEEIVPGDVVLIESGDIVPADLRIIESNSLAVNESSLTGESVPVDKNTDSLPIDTLLADRKNMVYSGTVVSSGNARGIAVATGIRTEFGNIAGLVSLKDEKTPLEKQISYIGKILTIVSTVMVIILFIIGYTRGYEILPLLTFVIALLVGAVPESLPTVITLALAIGVSRMAKNKAIVRRLAAVETLGTIKIIATDKTGTLTNNELSVDKIVTKNFHTIENASIYKTLPVRELFESAVICSNINYAKNELIGDPLEIGIAREALKLKIKPKKYKELMEMPFDSTNQYMAVLISQNGHKEMIVKGAPEKIASFCNNKSDAKKIMAMAEKLSQEGLKVIAVAKKIVDKNSFSNVNHLKFLGMVAMVDQPSEGIKEAFAKTLKANIRPVILTGDHPETARFVAEKIGLVIKEDEIYTGRDLDHFTNAELKRALSKVKVFARVSPEDKINIVQKFEEMGFPVLVTGDGVNDAAAIKRASVGVAMGIKGTDVAKDSADIVLSDDKYSTIVSAIEYGRTVYDNIRNSVIFLVSGNIGILFIVALTFIFDLPIPLLTVQILWINMVTDTMPAVALAMEKPSAAILSERPRPSGSSSMKAPILYSCYLSMIGIVLGMLLYLWGVNDSPEKARTLLFTYIVFQELIFCFSVRSPKRIWQSAKEFFSNSYLNLSLVGVIILQIIIFSEPFRKIFELSILNMREIIVLIVTILLTLLLSEIVRSKISEHFEGHR